LDIKEKIGHIPDSPGVYIFKDKESSIIYIGKSSSLKKRVRSYFSPPRDGKKSALLESISDIECIRTSTESTALLLESALVKRYNPRFNTLLKDDKAYPRIKLSINERYPRLAVVRKLKPDGAAYFGPFTNARLLSEAVKLLRRMFPLRTCRNMPLGKAKKGCLDMHIGQCLAPCLHDDIGAEYFAYVEELRLFLEGKQQDLLAILSRKMKDASDNKDYEKAARIRDRIGALSALFLAKGYAPGVSKDQASSDGNSANLQGLEELKSLLGLSRQPLVIEAFDVSNTSGKEAVGSMVCFKQAMPYKNSYMHFKIKTVDVIDDYSMMREIVFRRYKRLLAEKAPMPDLVLIDGGRGHLSAAKAQLRSLRIMDVPAAGIAKNPDKLYIHEKKDPVLLGNFPKALLLCQRIRDEAHRFAITYHRNLRSKGTRCSELDRIKGIGPRRKAELIKYFGSLDKVKTADMDRLKEAPFINEKEAKAVYDHFRV
jgi:excinuclease ABC subunit C